MQIVPLQAVPAQRFSVLLANQSCVIAIAQRSTGLFFELAANGAPVVAGVIGQNLNRLVRARHLGFVGDFVFLDTQGSEDPIYTGLGTRFLLAYLEASEVPAGEG